MYVWAITSYTPLNAKCIPPIPLYSSNTFIFAEMSHLLYDGSSLFTTCHFARPSSRALYPKYPLNVIILAYVITSNPC